ncbi:hypothetical protein ABVK25_001878 [Lepraria finkii]|uniref:Uncharacterized protein n=1 Tax=Lepraria finkii TaxID=1340010 RepID=A0ABR4BKN4_9LECA
MRVSACKKPQFRFIYSITHEVFSNTDKETLDLRDTLLARYDDADKSLANKTRSSPDRACDLDLPMSTTQQPPLPPLHLPPLQSPFLHHRQNPVLTLLCPAVRPMAAFPLHVRKRPSNPPAGLL